MVERVQVVVNIWKLVEFLALCRDFGQESYEGGFSIWEHECQTAILKHFPYMKLNFLDKEE